MLQLLEAHESLRILIALIDNGNSCLGGQCQEVKVRQTCRESSQYTRIRQSWYQTCRESSRLSLVLSLLPVSGLLFCLCLLPVSRLLFCLLPFIDGCRVKEKRKQQQMTACSLTCDVQALGFRAYGLGAASPVTLLLVYLPLVVTLPPAWCATPYCAGGLQGYFIIGRTSLLFYRSYLPTYCTSRLEG